MTLHRFPTDRLTVRLTVVPTFHYDHKVRRTPIRQYTGHEQLAINARDASLAKPSQPDALARERHRLHHITTIARPSLTRRVAMQSTSKQEPVRQWNAKCFDRNHCLPSSDCQRQTALRILRPINGDAEECLPSGLVKRPLSPAMLDEPTGMLRSQSPSYANSTIHRPCATRDECQGCVVGEAIPTRRVSEETSPVASHHDNRTSLANASGCHAKHFKAGNCSAMECKMFRT